MNHGKEGKMNHSFISKKNSKIKYNLIFFIIMGLFCFLLARLMRNHQGILEKYYSGTFNKWGIQLLSKMTGILPFSLGEILFVGHLIALPILGILFVYKGLKGGFVPFFTRVLTYFCILYVAFILMWGLNYSRMSIGEMMDLQTNIYSVEDLYRLNEALIIKANKLRSQIQEDSHGIMHLSKGYEDVFERSHKGFEKVGERIKALSGTYGRPKAIALSRPMLYTGITGIYFPFTAEANVNIATPHLLLPATVLHEMAHQRGFASEDEANYIAYLTATAHPDMDFQYSGTVLALIHSMGALYRQDPELALFLRKSYSEGLDRDIRHYNEFWRTYEGKVNETANKVNDTYLKSNGEREGTKSYGRVVDLLLGHFMKYGEI